MIDRPYPRAVGLLQAHCVHAAIEIESIVRHSVMDASAKAELLKTAAKLRHAERSAEALVEVYENGGVRA